MGGSDIPRMVDGGAKVEEEDEPWAKITSVVYFRKHQGKMCRHFESAAMRVCKGVDTGRRFLSCQYEETCGYVKWIDKPSHGRGGKELSLVKLLTTKRC